MTFKQLAKEICRREGKKKQVDIAQVSEILKHLLIIEAGDPISFFKVFGYKLSLCVTKGRTVLVERGKKK